MKIECSVEELADLFNQMKNTKIDSTINEREVRDLIRGVAFPNKIMAIKSVRSLLGLGLKEAKDLVEECTAQGASQTLDVPLSHNR